MCHHRSTNCTHLSRRRANERARGPLPAADQPLREKNHRISPIINQNLRKTEVAREFIWKGWGCWVTTSYVQQSGRMLETWSGARLWGNLEEAYADDASASVGRVPPRNDILELNHREHGVGVSLQHNVRYVGNGSHSTDVGAIQTSESVPSSSGVCYYEMTILDSGARRYISLGFAERDFKLNRQCGYVISTVSSLIPFLTLLVV